MHQQIKLQSLLFNHQVTRQNKTNATNTEPNADTTIF